MADDEHRTTLAISALVITSVFVGVGLPMWWTTTSVYRADLPLATISELAVIKPNYKVNITLVLPDITMTSSMAIIRVLLDLLTDKNMRETGKVHPSAGYSVSTRPAKENELQILQMSHDSISDLDEKMWHTVESQPGGYLVYQLPSNAGLHSNSQHPVYLGQHRYIYITSGSLEDVLPQVSEIFERVIVNTEMVSAAYVATTDSQQIEKKSKGEVMTAVRSKPGYQISFSLLNPEPNRSLVSWDIRTATTDHLRPLLDRLSVLGKFTVESQILRYVSLGVTPKLESKQGVYYLTQTDLPHTINPVESRLGTYVSSDPSLDFLVYVPPSNQSPLYILDENGNRVPSNAFLSPRWGGILVYNVNKSEEPQEVEVKMEAVMPVFVSQLRLLLGIPDLTPSLPAALVSKPHLSGISDWFLQELDGLLLRRCMENIATSTATLTSLIQLLEEVKNIVIADHIQTQIVQATSSIAKCHDHMKSGRLLDAFLLSKQAIESSETAFFDPSMLALLYFPEDQKFAIYVPLFVPVSIPLLLSTRTALRHLFKRKDECADDEQAEKKTDSTVDKVSTETT